MARQDGAECEALARLILFPPDCFVDELRRGLSLAALPRVAHDPPLGGRTLAGLALLQQARVERDHWTDSVGLAAKPAGESPFELSCVEA